MLCSNYSKWWCHCQTTVVFRERFQGSLLVALAFATDGNARSSRLPAVVKVIVRGFDKQQVIIGDSIDKQLCVRGSYYFVMSKVDLPLVHSWLRQAEVPAVPS